MDKATKQRMIWGAAATLMKKSKPIALAVYLSFGGSLLFLCLSFVTRLEIFVWLADFSLTIFAGIEVLSAIVNVRDYFQQKRTQKQTDGK